MIYLFILILFKKMKEKGQNDIIFPEVTNVDNSYKSINIVNTDNHLFELPQENKTVKEIKDDKKEEEEEKGEAEQNLLFGVKSISPFRLYYHISGKFEIFLMIAGTIFTIGAGCTMSLISLLIGETIDDFIDTNEINDLPDNEYKAIMDKVEPSINKMCKKYLIIGSIMFVCYFFMMFLWAYSSLRQMHWMKINYFYLILRQEQGWFDENNAFEFATKVQAQLEQIEMGVGDRFGQIILMLSELISGFVVGFISSWKLTLVLLCCAPFIVGSFIVMIVCMEGAMILSRKTYEKAGGIAEELLYNIKTVTSFVNFDYELKRFGNLVDEVEKHDKRKAFILGISVGMMIFGIYFGFAITLIYARTLIANRNINSNTGKPFTAGDVIKVLFAVIGAIFAIGGISPNIQIIKESCIAASDYFTLNDRVPKIFISEKNIKPDKNTIQGRIEFKNIKFIYPSDKNKRQILDNLNLVFEPGKKVALVGESGCGKSTTVNLIERLYEPIEGQILFDGIDIRDYNLEYLRSLIGYVQQEPVLFNRSIKDNIIFGREKEIKELGDSEELMKEACADAYIKEFIENNPDKYEYIVGVKGNKLSGGQKQRVAIARAILNRPKILILDEATSALDNQSEKEVQRALDNISQKNVTTIIIAHRLSTIKNADLIYALKGGNVLEQGTHEELLAKNGYYAGLIKSQLNEENLANKEENFSNMSQKKSSLLSDTKRISSHSSDIISESIKLEKDDLEEKKVKIERGRLWELIMEHKIDIFLGILGGFIYGAGSPISGFFLGKVTNAFSLEEPNRIRKEGLKWALLFLLVAIFGAFCIFLKIWKLEGLGSIISSRMRKKVLQKYLELHVGYYDIDSNSPGGLLTKLSIDTTQLSSLILTIFGAIISTSGAIITALIIGFIHDWKLTLIILVFIPFIVMSTVLMGNYRENGREGNKKIRIEAGSVLSECANNSKTIFSFNYQESALKMYRNILEKETKAHIKDSIMLGVLIGGGTFILFVSHAVVYKCALKFIRNRTLTFVNMNVVMNTLMSSTDGISDSLHGIGDYPKAKLSFKSIFKIMNTPSEINAFEYHNKNKQFPIIFKGKIEFKNVTFAYPTKPKQKILKNLSLTINPGEQVALVGYSGSGKSTIIQLIERFYDIKEGEILIDDINIKDYNLYELRRKIGMVSQEPVLFKRSVYENILYGKLDSSRDEVYNAAKKAAIEKFFNDKEMGTKEDPVSGGEKQRLAIARAFLKNPVILLLDEATSALDKESEKEVQKSIYELQKGRTSVSVAHRLSTIVDSDIIFVLESGRLIEQGNHSKLMEKKGKYYTLYKFSEK